MILELFAGSRSIGKIADKLNIPVFSSDIKDFDNIDYVCNILDFDVKKIPFKPLIIWASPPCTAFSVASIPYYWNKDKTPKKEALIHIEIVKKTLEIISILKPKYFYIENPRGMLRKNKIMTGIPRETVWYCKYGFDVAKPTDIWSNNIYSLFKPNGWSARPGCFNNNRSCWHEKSPRIDGDKGTQGKKDSYTRSIIPPELCMEILSLHLKEIRSM